MVSVFPSLLAWSSVSALLIRLTLAAVFIFWSLKSLRSGNSNAKILGLAEGVSSILLLIGLWTQVAALFALIDLAVRVIGRIRARSFLTDGVNYYLILLVLAISLLLTGPGFLAFDMPL